MKILDHDFDAATATLSYAGLLERIEILRSTLRWAGHLERHDIEKLLRQAGALRDEVMHLSHQERFIRAAAAASAPMPNLSLRQRREGLIAR
ncbi:MAG TPA: sigma-54-dependent Fis family transcriptional regulator, partial [Albitalea sp.]